MATYSQQNWDRVMEKWCATQAEALAAYPDGHELLTALDDILLAAGGGDPEEYSEAVSRYLRLKPKTGRAA